MGNRDSRTRGQGPGGFLSESWPVAGFYQTFCDQLPPSARQAHSARGPKTGPDVLGLQADHWQVFYFPGWWFAFGSSSADEFGSSAV